MVELQLRLDRGQMQRLGVSAQEVSGSISYALRGHKINKFHTEDGREIDIQVQLEAYDRKNLQDLRSITFSVEDGESAAGVAGRDLRGANARWHPPR